MFNFEIILLDGPRNREAYSVISETNHRMKFDNSFYQIEGLKIEWGKPFNEVIPLLEQFQKFKPHGGWPNIRCKCSEIWGLQTTEFEVRAPLENKPVLQVQYEVAPIKPGTFEKRHVPYLRQLEKVLGKQYKYENLYKQHSVKKEYLSSVVVFSAKWLFEDIRVSLSVYGDDRNKDSGTCAAAIFIDWIDEVKVAKTFREKNQNFEELMTSHLGNNIMVKKFKLHYKQRPFRVVNYELEDPYIAEKDHELRASQMALYKEELFATPSIISSQLSANEIGYYEITAMNKVFISNKWDTIYLTHNNENSITYWEILPARGSGGRQLDLKGLKIEDSKESPTLLDLVEQIEANTKQKIERKEGYDD